MILQPTIEHMKPIIILPPDTMSADDIKLLRDNEICVVVASNPAAVKFVDLIPAALSRTKIENAAIAFSRKILNRGVYDDNTRGNLAKMYVELLVKGTALDPMGSREEWQKQIFDSEKADELRRLARKEAKAERAAAKKVKKTK